MPVSYSVRPIGFIRSELKRRDEAPRQGMEGSNPLGLTRVTVRGIVGNRIRIGPIEAIDETR